MAYLGDSKWDGPFDFYSVIREWAENNKTIMYQFENGGIPFRRNVMHGNIDKSHNLNKIDITKAKWYIER